MTVNTKTAPHRELTLNSAQEILDELDRIEAAHNAGTLTHSGNWSPGQIFEHCSKLPIMAIDGVTFKGPLIFRILLKIPPVKKKMLTGDMPRGIQLSKDPAKFLLPKDDTTFEQGLAIIREQMNRIVNGAKMTNPSPIFGPLTHDQWDSLNSKHCAMHFGFMSYPDA
ncbi:MAG: DUF1569 domain-containing protein [Planctomycetota bacterium]|jgi:hypothetical protein